MVIKYIFEQNKFNKKYFFHNNIECKKFHYAMYSDLDSLLV